MKPQNAHQRQAVEAKKKLAPITEEQLRWGYDNAIGYVGVVNKNTTTCTKCNHSWKGEQKNKKANCPSDIKAAHDNYMKKKRAAQEQERKEKAKEKAIKEEHIFRELKERFFGVQFSDGVIQVRVLDSVADIIKEEEIMHHCVFTNEYHLNPESLILSSSIGEKPLETIEISLSSLQVVQSRGLQNKNTKYHKKIIKLVNDNMQLIRERLAA